MTDFKPLVSIISINYNEKEATLDLLSSIQKLEYKNFEVIIIDNASREDPSADISRLFPEVKIIMSDENLGFAGGNNLGIKEAKGEYLFFVNNDAVLSSDCISPLLETFQKHKDAGAVSPKFHYYNQPNIIEYAGYSSINSITGRNSTIGANEIDHGQYDQEGVTNYTHGGGMMVPKNIIELVGPMPEDYFLYYEEFDWCEKMKSAGYQIYYQPKALVRHKVSVSVGKNSTVKTYYLNRNRIYFMKRNKSTLSYITFMIFLILFTIPKNIIQFLVKNEKENLSAFRQAILWNFGVKSIPKL